VTKFCRRKPCTACNDGRRCQMLTFIDCIMIIGPVIWCRVFAVIFAIFTKVCRVFHHFLPWFSTVPKNVPSRNGSYTKNCHRISWEKFGSDHYQIVIAFALSTKIAFGCPEEFLQQPSCHGMEWFICTYRRSWHCHNIQEPARQMQQMGQLKLQLLRPSTTSNK